MKAILVFRGAVLGLLFFAAPFANGQTLWTGPSTNFTQFVSEGGAAADLLVPNAVSLTRASSQWLYNGITETSAGGDSPEDTLWAFGTIDNYSALSYQTFASFRNGDLAGVILNQPMVLQLINEQIYISIEFTAWGQHGNGGFSYTRSTPASAPPTPSVSITNPANGATFAAPANVTIAASASVSSGTVTNVSFFANTNLLGSATNAPFSVTASNLAAGSYALTAVATAAGVSATSAVVNITVVSAGSVVLSSPGITNGVFAFSYNVTPGLKYVVQDSSNFTTWLPVATNMPSSSPALFTNALAPKTTRYFRVDRVSSP